MTRASIVLLLCLFAVPASARQDLPGAEGWAALQRGDAAKASTVFRDALQRNPDNAVLHMGAGYASFVLGRHDAAISSLKRALTLDPRLVQAAVILAQVAYVSGDLDLAVRTLEKAEKQAPNDPRIAQLLTQYQKESTLHSSLEQKTNARFRVLFEGTTQKALGERVSRVLESAYWSVGKALNSYPNDTLNVILYTNRQFQDVTRAPAWAGGRYDGHIRLAVGGAMKTPGALDRVVVHEFVHAAIAYVAPRNVPAWVNEGLASILEGSDPRWIDASLARAREVYPLEDLEEGFGNLDGEHAAVAYAQSAVAAKLLLEKLGPNIGVFLQMLGNGHTADQALSTLNVRPETFHAEWKRRIGIK